MKIEGHHGQSDCTTVRLDPAGSDRSKVRVGTPPPSADRVNLSSEVDFVHSAVQAAASAPDVRADAVERARQKLSAGELGSNLERLADRIIDHVVTAG